MIFLLTCFTRFAGPRPVIPDCSVSVTSGVVFPDSGAVVNPGCDICILEGASVTLDCTVTSGDPPITYMWRDGITGVLLAETPKLTVTMPGNYSCNVANLDERTDMVASVLLCKSIHHAELHTLGCTNNELGSVIVHVCTDYVL